MVRVAYRQDDHRELPRDAGGSDLGAALEIDLQEFLRIIGRQKMVILATVIVVMALAFAIISSLTPRYTASTSVEIDPRETRVVDFESVLSGLPADTETIETEVKIIQSRRIAQRALSQLGFDRVPEFNPALRQGNPVSAWRRYVAIWLASLVGVPEDRGDQGLETSSEQKGIIVDVILGLAALLSPPVDETLSVEDRIKREEERIIGEFLRNLNVVPEGRSRIVRISFESVSPERAAAGANTIAELYIVSQLEAKFEATRRASIWLSERVEQLREEVDAKERAIEEYRAKSGLIQGGKDTTLTSEQVSGLSTQHVMELARLAEAEARLRQVNKLLASPRGIESAIEVLASPLIRDLRREESRLERQIAELSEEYGEKHPRMINARAELRDLKAKIKSEVDKIVQGLRNEVSVARARAATLNRSLENLKRQVARQNTSEVQLRALERESTASRTLLENLLQRSKQTISQQNFQKADANIISYAVVPERPSFPRMDIWLPLILLAALIQGLLLAFLLENLDHGVRSADQVERQLNTAPLGLVPIIPKLKAMGKAPHDYILDNPDSAYGEAIRSLYTNVLLSDMAQRPKVILFTSALPGEGKTSVTLSLARILANIGQKIMVVDCDLRRPTVHNDLKISSGPGLTECLTEQATVEEVIQRDKESGAYVIRAGAPVANPPALLDSAPMDRFLRNLARNYDLVILDSAPVLAVSDTLFLARVVDRVVFIVRWAHTRRDTAIQGLKRIHTTETKIAGGLLTMVDVKGHAKYRFGDSGTYYGKLKRYYTG